MAGPLQTILYRRPVRNAIRTLLGMQPRYGMMGNPVMGGGLGSPDADEAGVVAAPAVTPVAAPVQRAAPKQPAVRTTAIEIAPSPEAKAVAQARDEDSARRVAARRAEVMNIPAKEASISSGPLPPPPSDSPLANGQPAVPLNNVSEPVTSPPLDPRLGHAQALRTRSEAMRQQAEAFRKQNAAAFASDTERGYAARNTYAEDMARATADERMAMGIEAAIAAEAYGERQAQRGFSMHRMQHPDQSPLADATNLDATTRQFGPLVAGQHAFDAWAMNTKAMLSPVEKTQKLNEFKLRATGMALSHRIDARQTPRSNDPLVSDIASVVMEMAPTDPNLRANLVRGVVSSAQAQSGIDPRAAANLSVILNMMIEQQIASQAKR